MEALFELFPIVIPRAEHKLAVHFDAVPGKPSQNGKLLPGTGVFHHAATQLRVGGMHGNIDRADVHFEDSLDLPVCDIGKRDIIAEQEGKSGIIVFKIQAFAHSFRELVDKAEDAFIFAVPLPVHEIGFEFQPQVFVFALAQPDSIFSSAGIA